jgi:hypothetical protein
MVTVMIQDTLRRITVAGRNRKSGNAATVVAKKKSARTDHLESPRKNL